MHDALLMELADGDDDLRSIELDDILAEALLLLEYLVELATVDEWHDKV